MRLMLLTAGNARLLDLRIGIAVPRYTDRARYVTRIISFRILLVKSDPQAEFGCPGGQTSIHCCSAVRVGSAEGGGEPTHPWRELRGGGHSPGRRLRPYPTGSRCCRRAAVRDAGPERPGEIAGCCVCIRGAGHHPRDLRVE